MVRIAGVQGFYGDSPMGAIAIANAGAADYLVHDALAELTLSILQKDRMENPALGYARDIEFLATTLYPLALQKGIKIVTNSGGLNPVAAANKVTEILKKGGISGVKIAAITGDDMLAKLSQTDNLVHIETGEKFTNEKVTHANVYVGASCIAEALDKGAQIIFAGRVADPCLTLGILVHCFKWKLTADHENLAHATSPTERQAGGAVNWNLLASGITIGHLLECGGQATGGNSYAEWLPASAPTESGVHGYPIAHVNEDGSAIFTKLETAGGKVSRDTIREQLVYEIHDPANYITPDVIVDLTQITLEEIAPNQVLLNGAKGKPRPGKLKLAIGMREGFLSEQLFFFSYPFAYKKAQKFVESVKATWKLLPFIRIEKMEFAYIGINGIHGDAAPMPSEEEIEKMNEIGVRVAIKHPDEKTGKLAFQSIIALALNGPPGLISIPGWGKQNRMLLSLFPVLIDRKWVEMKVQM